MNRNVPHIYDHFNFDGEFKPENITVKFNSDTLVFVFQGKPVTIEHIYEIINSGRKVIRKDFQ